jgi:hypothetical protein
MAWSIIHSTSRVTGSVNDTKANCDYSHVTLVQVAAAAAFVRIKVSFKPFCYSCQSHIMPGNPLLKGKLNGGNNPSGVNSSGNGECV